MLHLELCNIESHPEIHNQSDTIETKPQYKIIIQVRPQQKLLCWLQVQCSSVLKGIIQRFQLMCVMCHCYIYVKQKLQPFFWLFTRNFAVLLSSFRIRSDSQMHPLIRSCNSSNDNFFPVWCWLYIAQLVLI